MKKMFVLILSVFMPMMVLGQELSVESFYLAETDLTANTRGTMEYDQNGNVCALIKIKTPYDGFIFDVGVFGVIAVKRVGEEIWVYVPYGIRKITVSHPELGIVRDYAFPCKIDKGRVYVMTLLNGDEV